MSAVPRLPWAHLAPDPGDAHPGAMERGRWRVGRTEYAGSPAEIVRAMRAGALGYPGLAETLAGFGDLTLTPYAAWVAGNAGLGPIIVATIREAMTDHDAASLLLAGLERQGFATRLAEGVVLPFRRR